MKSISKEKKWWAAFLSAVTVLAAAIEIGSTGLIIAACMVIIALIFAAANIWA